jgi:hypothetical protein
MAMSVRARWGRRILRVIGITLITVIAALIALELSFRTSPRAIPLGACQSSPVLGSVYCQTNHQYDDPPRLGYVFEPGYSYDGPWNPADPKVINAQDHTCGDWPDHTFHYTIRADDHGFINNATPWADQYDIVITGDSFTMPYAPVSWVDRLREKTGMSALNLGICGWGPLSEAEAVRMYGLDKNPRWVVMLYFEGNDLFNAGQYRDRWEAGVDWRTYELQQVDRLDRLIVPHVLDYWHNELAAALGLAEDTTVCRFPMTVTTNVNRFDTIFALENISQLSQSRRQIVNSEEWALVTQAILDLRAEVKAQGGRFLLVYVPSKERLYWRNLWDEQDIAHFLDLTTPLRSYAEFNAHVDDQMELVQAFARKNNVEFLNLTGQFWERTILHGDVLYNFADGHWNADGNELAAQIIATYINLAELEDALYISAR